MLTNILCKYNPLGSGGGIRAYDLVLLRAYDLVLYHLHVCHSNLLYSIICV